MGDLLVGAEGTQSATRRQLLPEAEVSQLERAIYGKTPLTPATLAWVHANLVDGASFFMNKFRRLGFVDYNGSGLEVHSSLLNLVLHG